MSKITRVFQKQFASAAPTSDVAQFGSLAAASPVTTKNPVTIQGLTAFLGGWASAVEVVGSQPSVQALEDVNALDFLTFYQLAYIFQAGIPEWDAETTYYTNSYVQVTGTLYKSLIDTNINMSPSSNPGAWSAVQSATPTGYLYGGVLSNDTLDPTDGITATATVAKDDSSEFTINAASLSKKINATWVAGDNNGGLDTSTIGGSPVKFYIFAIGKSTDPSAGDYLFSKSRTSPNMGLPNAAGFNIKRLIGQRYWDGTKIVLFKTSGNGVDKKTRLFDPIHILISVSATSFTDVDVSAYVDGNCVGVVYLTAAANAVAGTPAAFFTRPKGSSASTGSGTVLTQMKSSDANPGNTAGRGEEVINSSSIFQYAQAGGVNSDAYLSGFEESL